jgi:S-(hydroxymethyl)glutathione dehydrogenase/alcohol dehydrogenase
MSDTTGKVITCRAAVAWAVKQPLVIETVEVQPPRAHEVRIKIHATGICHSDASVLDGVWKGIFPVILGHEGAGIVESIGEGVTNFKPGDHVIPTYVSECGECRFCKSKRTNLCVKSGIFDLTKGRGVMADGTSRFTCNGKQIFHFMGTSTFSEYTVVSDIALAKVNEKAPLERICLIGCGIPTGYGAAINAAKVTEGSSCAIWGLGGVGLACAMGCKRAGATRIIGVDINPDKFELAKTFGVTEFINPKDYDRPIQEVLMEMSDGGIDFTFECAGNALTSRAALESAALGFGVSILIGIAGFEISTSPFQLVSGRTWKGAVFGGYKSENVPGLVDEYMDKKILVDEFITHTMALDKINEAFQLMHAGKSIRSVVIF